MRSRHKNALRPIQPETYVTWTRVIVPTEIDRNTERIEQNLWSLPVVSHAEEGDSY